MNETTQDIKKYYDSHAKQYKDSMQDFSFQGDIFEYFLSQLSGKEVLDIGCGFGRDVGKMRKLGYTAWGIDISEKMIEEADESIRDVLRLGDITKLLSYYSQNIFDGIFCSAALLHFEETQAIEVLSQSYEILKNDGIFFLSTKVCQAGDAKIVEKESLSTPGVIKKYVYYELETLETMLKDLGFQILKTHVHTPLSDTWGTFICKK